MGKISKILIANRGEIACRVIKTCREKGISTVAVFSDADKWAPHVFMADESIYIGPSPSSESYLLIENLLEAAKSTNADAIHPGYGFLSENATFAEACNQAGIRFIGPSSEAIRIMGDKTAARELMAKSGVPFPPGTTTAFSDISTAADTADEIGYPVLIKAAAGGGGKGMRIVHSKQDFENAVRAAKSEAKSAFGDDRVYIEKYLENPRHIEFQILADMHGNVLHLYDRECSIQRRHQKVIEEAPCIILDEELRGKMAEAAIIAAKACNYVGAGTIEFLVDKHRNFYFLEMNTRLQVEHPVTEWVTGLDLVGLQILVAEGIPLPLSQQDVRLLGHSIECRIYAEDPQNQFLPSTGLLQRHRVPTGPGIRVDAGIEEGQEVPIYYDPMISKLSTFGSTRDEAIRRMKRALSEYDIAGCKTTIPFCQFVMDHQSFLEADYDTHFIQNYYSPEKLREYGNRMCASDVLALAATLLKSSERAGSTLNPMLPLSSVPEKLSRSGRGYEVDLTPHTTSNWKMNRS